MSKHDRWTLDIHDLSWRKSWYLSPTEPIMEDFANVHDAAKTGAEFARMDSMKVKLYDKVKCVYYDVTGEGVPELGIHVKTVPPTQGDRDEDV